MKKLLILSLVLFLVGGIAMAQMGLTAGLDFDIGTLNVNTDEDKDGDEDAKISDEMSLRASIAYENDELMEGLTLSAELGLGFQIGYIKDSDEREGYESMPVGLDIGAGAVYNLGLTPDSSLDLGLNLHFAMGLGDTLYFNYHSSLIGPFFERGSGFGEAFPKEFATTDGEEYGGGGGNSFFFLVPHVRYNHAIAGVGDFFAGVSLPYMATSIYKDGAAMNLNINLGVVTDFGFGFEAIIYNTPYIKDEDYREAAKDANQVWFNYLELIPSFNYEDFIYAEVAFGIPIYTEEDDEGDEISAVKAEGIAITPEISFEIPDVDGLSIYINLPITGVGREKVEDERTVFFGLGIGARFSF